VDGQSPPALHPRYGGDGFRRTEPCKTDRLGLLHQSGADAILYSADGLSGRIYKLTLERQSGWPFRQDMGHQLKQFAGFHEWACPSENEIYTPKISELARAEVILNNARTAQDENDPGAQE